MKISATATSDVTWGSRMLIRKKVRTRRLRLSTCAITSASTSCGIVESTQIPSVFSTAFQKYSSRISSE